MAPHSIPTSWEISENGKSGPINGYKSLHNDVDIKIGIIYKNRKNIQKLLKLQAFWSIVFKQSEYVYGF